MAALFVNRGWSAPFQLRDGVAGSPLPVVGASPLSGGGAAGNGGPLGVSGPFFLAERPGVSGGVESDSPVSQRFLPFCIFREVVQSPEGSSSSSTKSGPVIELEFLRDQPLCRISIVSNARTVEMHILRGTGSDGGGGGVFMNNRSSISSSSGGEYEYIHSVRGTPMGSSTSDANTTGRSDHAGNISDTAKAPGAPSEGPGGDAGAEAVIFLSEQDIRPVTPTSKVRLRFATLRGTMDQLSIFDMQFSFQTASESTARGVPSLSSAFHPQQQIPAATGQSPPKSGPAPALPARGSSVSTGISASMPMSGLGAMMGGAGGGPPNDILLALAALNPAAGPGIGVGASTIPPLPMPLPMLLETVRIGLLHDVGRLLDVKLHPVLVKLDGLDARVRGLSDKVAEMSARCPPFYAVHDDPADIASSRECELEVQHQESDANPLPRLEAGEGRETDRAIKANPTRVDDDGQASHNDITDLEGASGETEGTADDLYFAETVAPEPAPGRIDVPINDISDPSCEAQR